jgi:serine/threonine protein kinase
MITPIHEEKDEDLDLTRTGMVMGTPFYMSPEQARGDRNLDARVDLYACGVILYEAITGRRPFHAANYNALLLQILTTSPRPARELRPALPQGFDEVLDKALSRDRNERFQSAAEFQRELQSLRDRHPSTGVGMDVSDLARQAQLRRPTPMAAIIPQGVKPTPARPRVIESPPIRREESEAPMPLSESTPSSVEIPILFSDTPLSGEQMPDLEAATATAIEDRPAMRERLPSSSDTDTTERRTDLAHLSMGKRSRAGALSKSVPRTTTTERGNTERAARPVFDRHDTEVDDNNATLIQAHSRRRAPKGPSPDDTVRMDGDATHEVSEARDRLSEIPVEPAPPVRTPRTR